MPTRAATLDPLVPHVHIREPRSLPRYFLAGTRAKDEAFLSRDSISRDAVVNRSSAPLAFGARRVFDKYLMIKTQA